MPSLLHSQMGIDGCIAGSSSQVLVLTIRDMKMGKKGSNSSTRKKKGDDSSKGGELIGEGECWDGSDNKICPGFSEEKKCNRRVSLTRDRKDRVQERQKNGAERREDGDGQ